MFKVECEKFETFLDAEDYAKNLIIGLPYGEHIMIETRMGDESDSYWEPTHRVERDRGGKPVVRR